MTFLSILFVILLALVSSVLDTSFFSFFEFWYATIILSFQILIGFTILGLKNYLLLFAALIILFFSALSSLPPIYLIIIFLIFPFSLFYLKKRLPFEFNFFIIILFFLLINFIFQALLMILSMQFSSQAVTSIASFSLINTSVGIPMYYIILRLKAVFRIEGSD